MAPRHGTSSSDAAMRRAGAAASARTGVSPEIWNAPRLKNSKVRSTLRTGNVSTVGAGVQCGEAETAGAEAEGADLGGHASESDERIETVCTCMQMITTVVSHLPGRRLSVSEKATARGRR